MDIEQILAALRFVAMGRPSHPEVVALAEHLAAIGAPAAPAVEPEQVKEDKPQHGRKKAD